MGPDHHDRPSDSLLPLPLQFLLQGLSEEDLHGTGGTRQKQNIQGWQEGSMSPRCLLGTRLFSLSTMLSTQTFMLPAQRVSSSLRGRGAVFASSFKGAVINMQRSTELCIVRARRLCCQQGKIRSYPSESAGLTIDTRHSQEENSFMTSTWTSHRNRTPEVTTVGCSHAATGHRNGTSEGQTDQKLVSAAAN